uniref:Dynamin N-terminal domain-containing protein n=1 Tax=Fervidobacterium pennivorans TaxID=93466 RepID=A0A7V4KDW9_FERPE
MVVKNFEQLIELREKLEEVLNANFDLIEDEFYSVKYDNYIESTKQLKELFEKEQEKGRYLNVGIVGRVKAGKSSLLNAILFDGETILPKAATPMTAALTVVTYDDKYSIEVEYFTQEDITDFKNKYEQYKSAYAKLVDKKIQELREKSKDFGEQIRKRAEILAKRELENKVELVAAYEQYIKIKESTVDISTLGKNIYLEFKDLNELKWKLNEYVGANGKYTPFVKSLTLSIPIESLRGIRLIDTPGLNDPVISREQKTREFLRNCDVIFVVSPSGQFLSEEDQSLLDRITTSEAVRKIYIVASQIDTQLFGSIKQDANEDLHEAIELITEQLSQHLVQTLSNLKRTNPEIGDAFDQIIENPEENIVCSSAISFSLSRKFSKKHEWDEGMKTVWENLKYHYPDYFSETDEELSISNLNRLANIEKIRQYIEEVKLEKNKIIQERQEKLLTTKLNALRKFTEALISAVKEKKELLEKGTSQLAHMYFQAVSIYEDSRYEILSRFRKLIQDEKIKIKEYLKAEVDKIYETAKSEIEQSQSEEDIIIKKKKTGLLAGFLRIIGSFFGTDWGYEKEYKTIITVMAGTVLSSIEEFIAYVEDRVRNSAETLKRELNEKVEEIIKNVLNEKRSEKIDILEHIDPKVFYNIIDTVVKSIEYPEIEYSTKIPSELKKYGKLEDADAIQFLQSAQEFIVNLRKNMKRDIDNYVENTAKKLENLDITEKLFKKFEEYVKNLQKQLDNKKEYLERYQRIVARLEEIANQI